MLLALNPPGSRPCCSMPYFPEPGVDRESHSDEANKYFYVVFRGHIPGTYTDSEVATNRLMGSATGSASEFRDTTTHSAMGAGCLQTHGTLCPVAEAERRVLQAKVPQGTIGPSSTGIPFSKVQREFIKLPRPHLRSPKVAASSRGRARVPGATSTVSAEFGRYLNAIGHSVPAARVNPPRPRRLDIDLDLRSSCSAFAQMGTATPVDVHWGVKGIYRTYATRFDALAAAQKLQIPASDVFGDSDPAVVEAWCKRA
ncbi:hypothetical protein B0H13DRAFT_2376434 [Mycena leptocephala]|nr:hypothetical protein B0H13DRAFT_2376434 [Mycena leptocephala]